MDKPFRWILREIRKGMEASRRKSEGPCNEVVDLAAVDEAAWIFLGGMLL
jgi:hypothetical protein